VAIHRIAWARPMKNTPGGVFRPSRLAPYADIAFRQSKGSRVIEGDRRAGAVGFPAPR
jgi:hypothetical protein